MKQYIALLFIITTLIGCELPTKECPVPIDCTEAVAAAAAKPNCNQCPVDCAKAATSCPVNCSTKCPVNCATSCPVNCGTSCPVNCTDSCPIPPINCGISCPINCGASCPNDCSICPSSSTEELSCDTAYWAHNMITKRYENGVWYYTCGNPCLANGILADNVYYCP